MIPRDNIGIVNGLQALCGPHSVSTDKVEKVSDSYALRN